MLSDKLRDGANSKGFKTLLALIIVSFVLTGVGGYLIPRLNTDPVTIGEYKVTNQQWTEQYNRRSQELHRYGPQAAEMLENPAYVANLKKQVLESMVDQMSLNAAVWEHDVRIGDEQVREVIRTLPAFQKDGKFNNELYLATVRNMGLSPEYFGENLRVNLMTEAVSSPLLRVSAEPMDFEVEQLAKIYTQMRIVDLYTVDEKALAKDIKVSDEEAKVYYDQNHDQFMAPANVRFNYILLSLDDLKKEIKVTKEALEEYFNMYSDDFRIDEQRQISHLLVRNDNKNAKEIVAKIEEGLKNGVSFESLAKEYSEDKATKDKGGDMGFISRGQLAANLENATFALEKKGDISKKISDSYGTHFIALTDIKPAHVPALNDVKEQVKLAFLNAKARELYNEKVTTMSDISFENPDSLDMTAEAVKIKAQDSGLVNFGDLNAKWPFNTKSVQDLAFNEEVYSSGQNSLVVSIDDDHSIVINVYEHHDASLKNFEDVSTQAIALVKKQKIDEQAQTILSDLATKLKNNQDVKLDNFIKDRKNVTIAIGSSEVEPEFGQAIFALPRTETNASFIDDNNGAKTLAILKRVDQNTDDLEQFSAMLKTQLAQYRYIDAQGRLYRQARSLNDIKYNQEAIDLVISNNAE